jgi:hypothetical protein
VPTPPPAARSQPRSPPAAFPPRPYLGSVTQPDLVRECPLAGLSPQAATRKRVSEPRAAANLPEGKVSAANLASGFVSRPPPPLLLPGIGSCKATLSVSIRQPMRIEEDVRITSSMKSREEHRRQIRLAP